MKRILILRFTDPRAEPRVSRQLALLRSRYAITVAATADPELDGVAFVKVEYRDRSLAGKVRAVARLRLGAFERYYASLSQIQSARRALEGQRFDLIIAHDLETTPLALDLARGARVLVDAHEYAPREFEDRLKWRLLFQPFREYLCRTYLPRVDALMTVCQGIAEEYDRNYGTKAEVVTNASRFHDLAPVEPEDGTVRMIHHGAAFPSRRLEDSVALMRHLDERFRLDFMLARSDEHYLRSIQRLARNEPRIRFLPPVPMAEIVPVTNAYDVGLFLLPPTNFNYRLALPNKLFEFLQARLAVAIGPSPEMARILDAYDCGIVAEDFAPRTLAAKLNRLDTAALRRYKANADRAAREINMEQSSHVLLGLVERLVG